MGWRHVSQQAPRIALGRFAVLLGLALVAALFSISPAHAGEVPDGAETATAAAMMVVIGIFFIAAIVGIWWSHRNGEFEQPEEVKYEMLAMVEDEPDYWDMGRDDEEEASHQAPRLPAKTGTSE